MLEGWNEAVAGVRNILTEFTSTNTHTYIYENNLQLPAITSSQILCRLFDQNFPVSEVVGVHWHEQSILNGNKVLDVYFYGRQYSSTAKPN